MTRQSDDSTENREIPAETNDEVAALVEEVAELRRRLEHLEQSLGVDPPS